MSSKLQNTGITLEVLIQSTLGFSNLDFTGSNA